jgi:hypothetical protein
VGTWNARARGETAARPAQQNPSAAARTQAHLVRQDDALARKGAPHDPAKALQLVVAQRAAQVLGLLLDAHHLVRQRAAVHAQHALAVLLRALNGPVNDGQRRRVGALGRLGVIVAARLRLQLLLLAPRLERLLVHKTAVLALLLVRLRLSSLEQRRGLARQGSGSHWAGRWALGQDKIFSWPKKKDPTQ